MEKLKVNFVLLKYNIIRYHKHVFKFWIRVNLLYKLNMHKFLITDNQVWIHTKFYKVFFVVGLKRKLC